MSTSHLSLPMPKTMRTALDSKAAAVGLSTSGFINQHLSKSLKLGIDVKARKRSNGAKRNGAAKKATRRKK